MQKMKSTVVAIVLNWNSWDYTVRCLRSLLSSDYHDLRVIVVDNGSEELPNVSLLEEFPSTTYLETGKNLGYAAGNNVGIRSAMREGADFIWIVNPDVIVEQNTLSKMVHSLQSDERNGVAGPLILFEDERTSIRCAGFQVIRDRGCRLVCIGYREKAKALHGAQDLLVDSVQGGCMLIKRTTLEEVGLLPQNQFLHWEEIDWCHRAKLKGWNVLTVRRARCFHHKANGPRFDDVSRYYYETRNHLYYARKHFPEFFWRAIFRSLANTVQWVCLESRNEWRLALSLAKYCAKGTLDAVFFQKMGPLNAKSRSL